MLVLPSAKAAWGTPSPTRCRHQCRQRLEGTPPHHADHRRAEALRCSRSLRASRLRDQEGKVILASSERQPVADLFGVKFFGDPVVDPYRYYEMQSDGNPLALMPTACGRPGLTRNVTEMQDEARRACSTFRSAPVTWTTAVCPSFSTVPAVQVSRTRTNPGAP